MKDLIIYTDGAYSSARNQGGVGLVFIQDDKLVKAYGKMFKNVTNNKMELAAVIIALQSAYKTGGINKITIYSDSQYVIGCATKGWKRKKNINLWKKYDQIKEKLDQEKIEVKFKWVHGHNGDKFNEMADQLAVDASQEIDLNPDVKCL